MVDLIVPDMDEAVMARLEERAVLHGRTLNDEVLAILDREVEAVDS